ncbi:uncharacterized protein [Amphiura filiformis]|uniref:uncharacterized protein n=1 Tax=Amphiura filiformis TaxID=82378 RepID=UPI003B218D8E
MWKLRTKQNAKDIIERIKEAKWRWAGHIARRDDNIWIKRLTEWQQRTGKRRRGRQKRRWRDDLTSYLGTTWAREAQNRSKWKLLEEGYIRQWMIQPDKTQRSRSDLDRNWRVNTSTRDTGNQDKWVRNFSNRQLTDNETSLLCKGLGYAVTSNKIPIADIVTATESAIKQAHLDPGKSEELRQRISSTLRNSKPPPSNLTKEERAALNDLEKDKSIIIVPADKGKCVCVLNETDYRNKCSELLSDNNTYKRIGYNPTSGYRKKVCQFVNKLETDGAIIDKEKYNLILIPSQVFLLSMACQNSQTRTNPLRPIVSCIGSVTYNLAKHLTKILSPIVGKSPHHITNTQDFVDKIKDIELGDDEIITSYDVTALFTCIPPTEAIKITRQCLEEDSNLANRTTWTIDHIIEAEQLCLDTTYFSNNGQFYRQLYGCSMGNPISPIIANLVMEWFEQHALETYQVVPPRLWLRYVDDTFVIINRHEQDNFFKHINSMNSDNIKFTQEKCTDNKLAFLDCHVQINNERKLTTVVYRKPTHTDHYLQFRSHHPLVHKLGVIRTLHYRAETIISEEINVPHENDHIDGVLRKCGYPDWAFEQAKRKKAPVTPNEDSEQATRKTLITIPYCAGVSERVKNIYKLFGITTTFKPVNKLRGKLVHVKDKPPRDKQSNLVYGYKCGDSDCTEAYVGETKQSLKARLGQHRRPSSTDWQPDTISIRRMLSF